LKTWDENLIYIQHSYNKAVHTSTSKLAFETCFGYLTPSPLDVVYGKQGGVKMDLTRDALNVEKIVENIKKTHLQVQKTLHKSQEKYKARHDQHKTKRTFRVGDRVWLHLNKERIHGPGKKTKALWYGPFEVLEKVGDNAYRLNLPPYL
jgi:hypothetical protein